MKYTKRSSSAGRLYSTIKELKLEATTIINKTREVLMEQLTRLEGIASFYERIEKEVKEMEAPLTYSFLYNPTVDIGQLNCELQKAIE